MMRSSPCWRPELGLEPQVLLLSSCRSRALRTTIFSSSTSKGLMQVVVGPELHGGHGGLGGAEGGHHDDHRSGDGGLHVAQDLDAVAVRELDVGDDDVHRAAARTRGRRPRGSRR